MSNVAPITTSEPASSADDVIAECMNPDTPQSFFLYAGAGSGKTRSLVSALEAFRLRYRRRFELGGRRVGVITYTNAARDEIERRLGLDPLFHVSTIHSFCWSLIQGVHADIRAWLKVKLSKDIAELQAQQAKGRAGTKAAQDRERSIDSKTRRLARLDTISAFTYNPNGDNYGKDSLSHAEVLQIASSFILNKPRMQMLLINRFPFLCIDESQDTNKELVDALFAVERAHVGHFGLGLFGDTMQRIYSDGKHDLGLSLPDDWKKPAKPVNYRSAKRIVALGNALRKLSDGQEQTSPDEKPEGQVRLFIAKIGSGVKKEIEQAVREKMAEVASDDKWLLPGGVTVLALEHHMAASRLGFAEMFLPLYAIDRLKRGLIDGDLPGVRLFSERVYPLIEAHKAGDRFRIAEILRRHSPLLKADRLAAANDQRAEITKARDAVESLAKLIEKDGKISFLAVLRHVSGRDLFEIPESLLSFVEPDKAEFEEEDEAEEKGALAAWRQSLESPYFQIEAYKQYVADENGFDTHHGVKGLQFERVLVLIDDSESRGFLYSYEKLLGVTPLSASDLQKKKEGQETGFDRTLRLLYVTCTRAQNSLAVLAYTENPAKVRAHAIAQGWFLDSEIVLV